MYIQSWPNNPKDITNVKKSLKFLSYFCWSCKNWLLQTYLTHCKIMLRSRLISSCSNFSRSVGAPILFVNTVLAFLSALTIDGVSFVSSFRLRFLPFGFSSVTVFKISSFTEVSDLIRLSWLSLVSRMSTSLPFSILISSGGPSSSSVKSMLSASRLWLPSSLIWCVKFIY